MTTSSERAEDMTPLQRLVAGWQDVIDQFKTTFPAESWAHFRLVDDRWEIVEKGVTPNGFRALSQVDPLFQITFHEPWQEGDRFVLSEQISEYVDGEFRKLG